MPEEPFDISSLNSSEQIAILNQIAKSKTTPSELLWQLYLTGTHTPIMESLAGNPSTPPDLLERIFKDNSGRVVYSSITRVLIGNPNTPDTILHAVAFGSNGLYAAQALDRLYREGKTTEQNPKLTTNVVLSMLAESLSVPIFANLTDGTLDMSDRPWKVRWEGVSVEIPSYWEYAFKAGSIRSWPYAF